MVRVEFMGMPRQYAGCDSVELPANTLDELLQSLAVRCPALAEHCFEGNAIKNGFLLGVNSRFDTVSDAMPLQAGDTVQLLSADVGGH